MRLTVSLAAPLALALAAVPLAAPAQDKPAAKADHDKGDAAKPADDADYPPLPADKSVRQSAVIGGRTIAYTATVGTIPIYNDKHKKIGQVVYTAYTVPGADPSRPVTFAFNGGPGASSVFLNLGAIGPKKIDFGVQGDNPSDSAIVHDNPSSWLDMTDLVFIDPIGTGFSRSLEDEDQTKKDFYSTEPDIHYLSRVVYDWLVKNGRLRSPKYVIGESYGGYRVPRIAYYLQTQLGVGVSGMFMVSPYLDPASVSGDNALSPLPYMYDLPAFAAAKLEREGKLSAETMAPVISYTQGEFMTDLMKGLQDKAAVARLDQHVIDLTGLDPELVREMNGRIDAGTYLRAIHRKEGKLGSVYDSNVTTFDPFPSAPEQEALDPILAQSVAPTTSAMVDFVTRVVGWQTDARYHALSYEVNSAWDRGTADDKPVQDLRKAISSDDKMTVMIAHGWNDLSCPFMGSKLLVEQMPDFGQQQRVHLDIYPGGHMFYARPDSAAKFKADARALIEQRG
jgi:carboxypeptidase C (cathepsin A)